MCGSLSRLSVCLSIALSIALSHSFFLYYYLTRFTLLFSSFSSSPSFPSSPSRLPPLPSQLFPTRTWLFFSITRLGFHWDPEKITRDVALRTAELLRRRDEERRGEEQQDAERRGQRTQRHGVGKQGGVDIEMSAVGGGAGGVADNNVNTDNNDNLERLARDTAQNHLAKERREAGERLLALGPDGSAEPLRWGSAVQWGPLRVFWLGEEGKGEPKRVKEESVCVVVCVSVYALHS